MYIIFVRKLFILAHTTESLFFLPLDSPSFLSLLNSARHLFFVKHTKLVSNCTFMLITLSFELIGIELDMLASRNQQSLNESCLVT